MLGTIWAGLPPGNDWPSFEHGAPTLPLWGWGFRAAFCLRSLRNRILALLRANSIDIGFPVGTVLLPDFFEI
jgi:hypothetical protein